MVLATDALRIALIAGALLAAVGWLRLTWIRTRPGGCWYRQGWQWDGALSYAVGMAWIALVTGSRLGDAFSWRTGLALAVVALGVSHVVRHLRRGTKPPRAKGGYSVTRGRHADE